MNRQPNPQIHDPPSGELANPDHPATSVAVPPNNSDQSQSQPTVPDSTKLTPNDANQSNKRNPKNLRLPSNTATSVFKGTPVDAIKALDAYKDYVESAITELENDPPNVPKAVHILNTMAKVLDKDLDTWCNALPEASMPSSTYTEPVSKWQGEFQPGTPAAREFPFHQGFK